MTTEIICYPDSMEFGGVTWTKDATSDGMPRYSAYLQGRGEVRVSQYDQSSPSHVGHWHWSADHGSKLVGVKLMTLNKWSSGIEDTYQLAMMSALDAESMLISDIGTLLNVLCPDSLFAQGFVAGQEDIKFKVAEVLQ